MAVEADPIADRERPCLPDVVEERREREHQVSPLEALHDVDRVNEHIPSGWNCEGWGTPRGFGELGEDNPKKTEILHHPKRAAGVGSREHPRHLLADSLAGEERQEMGARAGGALRRRVEGGAEARRESDRTQQSERVLVEALPGLSHRAHEAPPQILEAADPVEDLARDRIRIERIDREVAPLRVFLEGDSECQRCRPAPVDVRSLRAKCGDLDRLLVEENRERSVAHSGVHHPIEQRAHFVGARGGRDVEIVGSFAEQRVANATPARNA